MQTQWSATSRIPPSVCLGGSAGQGGFPFCISGSRVFIKERAGLVVGPHRLAQGVVRELLELGENRQVS